MNTAQRVRVLLPIALAFSLAAGSAFSVIRLVELDASGIKSALVLPDAGAPLGGVEWSAGVTGPGDQQTAVLERQLRMAFVLAGILALGSLLSALAFEVLRNTSRREELAIHRAVGASRTTLSQVAAIEAGMVTLFGIVMGWALGSSLAELSLDFWPGTMRDATSPLATFGTACALCAAFFAFAFGAWQTAVGPGSTPPGVALQTPPRDPYSGIAVLQVAGSVALLVVAAILVGAGSGPVAHTASKEGFIARIRGSEPVDTVRLLARLERLGGLASAWATSREGSTGLGTRDIALTECGRCWIGTSPVNVKGEDAVHFTLAWLGDGVPVEIVQGRGFDSEDTADSELVAVVSEGFAQRNFENGDAVGRRVRPGADWDAWHRVVGVVADGLPRTAFGSNAQPGGEVYLSSAQHPTRSLDLRITGPVVEASLLEAMGEVVGAADITISAFSEHLEVNQAPARWLGAIFSVFGLAALLSALLGIRSVTRLSLIVRRSQMGIHRAVGARRGDLARLALGQPLRASLIGTALGLYAAMFFLDPLSDAVGAPVPPIWILVGIAVLHVLAALAGALPPTLRFVRTSPHRLITGSG